MYHESSRGQFSQEKNGGLGPGRTGQIFVYFAKKSVTSCLGQVRPVNFRSTESYQTSKTPLSCLRAGQIFVRHEI